MQMIQMTCLLFFLRYLHITLFVEVVWSRLGVFYFLTVCVLKRNEGQTTHWPGVPHSTLGRTWSNLAKIASWQTSITVLSICFS